MDMGVKIEELSKTQILFSILILGQFLSTIATVKISYN